MHEFLAKAAERYELVLFSPSHQYYVDAVLDIIDPDRQLFKHIVPRKHCVKIDDMYIKPLKALGRDIRRTVIVDNSSFCFCKELGNGIPIVPFFDNKNDLELLMLLGYLEQLESVSDVREFNKKHFKLHRYAKHKDLKHLYDDLFQ